MTEPVAASPPIDHRRYRRVRRFFLGVALHLFWWDIFLSRPLLRFLRPDPLPRWTRLAARYRTLAVDMGGVLIKLGQYLSTRVDVLPLAVTRELSGLQDEVPEEDFAAIVASLEKDLGGPWQSFFEEIETKPLGAASLAQVHAARLKDESGEPGEAVVVKVLRPEIEVLVETDLKAVGLAVRWLKGLRFVRKRVDLDWLVEEFTETTREELDLENEGRNAERFAEDFAGDPWVHVPKIYWQTSARRTLTMENVAFVKMADEEALDAAGVSRPRVAKELYRVYMEQIFVHNFVHADPHPGNLFVRPLDSLDPGDDGEESETGETGVEGRPFQIVFVDFGMTATVPERLRGALRDLLLGLGDRDAGRMVAAASKAGVLLPGADLEQLEEAAESILDRFWGTSFTQLNEIARAEAVSLLAEFGRLLLDTPIQVQADLLFVGRAFELLSGLATRLDPDFNPWAETVPFAQRLAMNTATATDWPSRLAELASQGRDLVRLPFDLAQTASQARQGRLTVRTALAPDSRRRLLQLERGLSSLKTTLAGSALLVTSALLYGSGLTLWVTGPLFGVGLVALVWGWWRG